MNLGGGLHSNAKTLYSVDFTTVCSRMRKGTPCAYCYVTKARERNFRAKALIDHIPYNGFVKKMTKDLIRKLNELGGIRLFAFADYVPEIRPDIEAFLSDCEQRGLRVKAITKRVDFVRRFASHPAISTVHVSIDSLRGTPNRSPISHKKARELREKYEKALVRAVVLDWRDVEKFGEADWVDILTLNHVTLPPQLGRTFHRFSRAEHAQLAKQFPGRVCCAGPTPTCAACDVKCGVRTL